MDGKEPKKKESCTMCWDRIKKHVAEFTLKAQKRCDQLKKQACQCWSHEKKSFPGQIENLKKKSQEFKKKAVSWAEQEKASFPGQWAQCKKWSCDKVGQLKKETLLLVTDLKNIGNYSDDAELERMRATRLFLFTLMILCTMTFLWMCVAPLDVVSMTQGQVTPSSDLKSIQHLEGGIIKAIHVAPGDRVVKGQDLVLLDATATGAAVMEMENKRASMLADVARLNAEAISTQWDRRVPEFPKPLETEHADVVEAAKQLFTVRQNRYFNEIQSYDERIVQKEQDLIEARAKLRNLRRRSKFIQEQVGISEELLAEELTNRYNHLEILREASALISGIEEAQTSVKRAESALQEMSRLREGMINSYLEEVNSTLNDRNKQLRESEDRLLKLRDTLNRTTIVAPEGGIVKDVYFKTTGGVIKPGETVLDLIPADDQLVIEAKLSVQDVGYVAEGQRATMRLASSDAMRFDALEGEVIFIAGDTTQDSVTGEYFYKVRIQPAQGQFKRAGTDLIHRLYPGMQVTANIVTGRRRVIEYVFTPFLNSSYAALQER